MGAFFAMVVATIVGIILSSIIGAAIVAKLGPEMMNQMQYPSAEQMENFDWDSYFEDQGGSDSDSGSSGEYVNPFEKL